MTESHRQNLLQACAFAKVFIEAADAELRGASSERREEATEHLIAALITLKHAPHIDADWDRECQESGRVNR